MFLSSISFAQRDRWQYGVGTTVHLTNYDMVTLQESIEVPLLLRNGAGAFARYELNGKGKFSWGAINQQLTFYLDMGVMLDWLSYAYTIDEENITQDYLRWEIPIHFIIIGDSRHFPFWHKRHLHGYGRFGLNIGWVANRTINFVSDEWQEITEIGGINTNLYIGTGLLQKQNKRSKSSVGIYSKLGVKGVVNGQITGARFDNALHINSLNFQVGLEWFYFFPPISKRIKLEEIKPAILCPHF